MRSSFIIRTLERREEKREGVGLAGEGIHRCGFI
jgi:hypothetical protein